MRTPSWLVGLAGCAAVFCGTRACARSDDAAAARVVVESGAWERRDTPIAAEVEVSQELIAGLRLNESAWELREIVDGKAGEGRTPVELEAVAGDADEGADRRRVRVLFVLPGVTPANTTRVFTLIRRDAAESPWSLATDASGVLALRNRQRPVFHYNENPTHNANYPATYDRSAYIHPAFTPSGKLITGDYSRSHPHHRGFFLAYAKTNVGGREIDFWNLHRDAARIRCVGIEDARTGAVAARFRARHEWSHPEAGEVLRETWDVVAYDIPGSPYWLIDLTSTQEAVAQSVELVPYRYGGMAYRGPDSFLPPALLDVQTSEGLNRQTGDQKPARWVDLTGSIAAGAAEYAGAMMADHVANHGHPTVARIHPTTLPFFTFVPGYQASYTLARGRPEVFRYRILIHDGRPDAALDERVFRDFVEPPRVMLEALGK